MEINIGDRLWFKYFGNQTIITGYVVEVSPNYQLIKISDVDVDEYTTIIPRPGGFWCEVKHIEIIDIMTIKQVREEKGKTNKFVGFLPTN